MVPFRWETFRELRIEIDLPLLELIHNGNLSKSFQWRVSKLLLYLFHFFGTYVQIHISLRKIFGLILSEEVE